jgi:hypothetical protein
MARGVAALGGEPGGGEQLPVRQTERNLVEPWFANDQAVLVV